jgi:hypothetical protein
MKASLCDAIENFEYEALMKEFKRVTKKQKTEVHSTVCPTKNTSTTATNTMKPTIPFVAKKRPTEESPMPAAAMKKSQQEDKCGAGAAADEKQPTRSQQNIPVLHGHCTCVADPMKSIHVLNWNNDDDAHSSKPLRVKLLKNTRWNVHYLTRVFDKDDVVLLSSGIPEFAILTVSPVGTIAFQKQETIGVSSLNAALHAKVVSLEKDGLWVDFKSFIHVNQNHINMTGMIHATLELTINQAA